MATDPPRRVSHFEIHSELGRGGMGIVYRATDLNLARDVALKRIWPELASDPTALRRFRREGRVGARLLHPNIVPVLDVFEEGGSDWIVMELVDGESLREKLARDGRLPIDKVLRYAEGLAEALQVAHARGVLHRDVSPKNILIDATDRARLSDFGLVRTIPTREDDSEATTISESITADGAILGTMSYMAPEQLLGHAERRSDLFSLGTVIYEMCTGVRAFSASEQGDLLDAILHRQPEPMSRLSYEIPEELDRIVRKCLRKDAEERYPDATDLLVDIRALRRRIDHRESRGTSGISPRVLAVGIAAFLLAVAAGTWWTTRSPGRREALPLGRPFQLTSSIGWESDGSLSPDGGLVAYASDASGNPDVWIIDVRGGNPLQITHDEGVDRSPAWTPDSSTIVFVSDRSGVPSIWKVPRLGGSPTMLVANAEDPAVSPDGTTLAFVHPATGDARIMVAPIDDAEHKRALTGDDDGLWSHRYPAWSPDGKTLCYSDRRDLWLVDVDRGRPRRLTTDGGRDLEMTWSADGEQIYFSSGREGTFALWRVSVSNGTPQRVTTGAGPERRPGVSRDGKRLVYSTAAEDPDLMFVDLGTGATGKPYRRVEPGIEQNVAVAPDGSAVVFVSDRWEKYSLWIQPLKNHRPDGQPRRLTDHEGGDSNPAYSPDGRWIAYQRLLGDRRDVWLLSPEGGQSTRFTDDEANDMHPTWSPDGSRIAFVSDRGGASDVWVRSVENGMPVGRARRMTDGKTTDLSPAWSPDGAWLAYIGIAGNESEVYLMRADATRPPRPVTRGAVAHRVRWDSATGTMLVSGSWGAGSLELLRVEADGGPPSELNPPVSFGPMARFGDFDIGSHGELLVITREDSSGDVWIMEAQAGTY